jgi:hypothetical protein
LQFDEKINNLKIEQEWQINHHIEKNKIHEQNMTDLLSKLDINKQQYRK